MFLNKYDAAWKKLVNVICVKQMDCFFEPLVFWDVTWHRMVWLLMFQDNESSSPRNFELLYPRRQGVHVVQNVGN